MMNGYSRNGVEIWAGIECSYNRVDNNYMDQLNLSGHYERCDDVQRIAALGFKALRYPVLWDYQEVMNEVNYKKLIFTGPVDEYFNFKYGKLPYRSLRFKFETIESSNFQETGTINYPNDYAFTRITEFKHLTGQKHDKTTLVYEFPEATGDPYYPVPRTENDLLYKKYAALANQLTNTYFVGRLATYRYYNMDQVVAQALTTFKKITQADLSAKLPTDDERILEKRS